MSHGYNRSVRFAALLLLAAAAFAAEPAEIVALIDRLGAEDFHVREEAFASLLALGVEAQGILREAAPPDTEARRAIARLLHGGGDLTLSISAPPRKHRIGERLTLEVTLTDSSGEPRLYQPASSDRGLHAATLSSFVLRVGGEEMGLTPDQVTIVEGESGPFLQPSKEGVRCRIALEREQVPFRAPGRAWLAVVFRGSYFVQGDDEGWGAWRQLVITEATPVSVESPAVEIEVIASTLEELTAALDGGTAEQRESAAAELAIRVDEALLPLLRSRIGLLEVSMRAAAVRRLGLSGKEEDLAFVLDMTRDAAEQVRIAATEALGNFPQERARLRLLSLAGDEQLQLPAVEALARRKSPQAVARFLAILKGNRQNAQAVERICSTLYDWTGIVVSLKRTEVEAFERWWLANRETWTAAQR